MIPKTYTVTVQTTLTNLATLAGADVELTGIKVRNTGATAFDDFQILARLSPEDVFSVLKSSDFTGTPADTFPTYATVNPITLAGGSDTIILLSGIYYEVLLQASVASGTTTATVYALSQG